MAISDSHAMHRMPAASTAATSTSSSSSVTAVTVNQVPHNTHKGTTKDDTTTARTVAHRGNDIAISEEKKWHYLQQQQQHSWTAGSTLSRSMRYADPWLNSTVAAVANGSGKYGTVRCHTSISSHSNGQSSSQQQQLQQQRRAGTLRVTSSTSTNGGRGRPTVLPKAADPYDLVRRSRLGRSVSPDNTLRRRSDGPPGFHNTAENRFMSAYATFGRRSILECDVNPYDLMDNNQDDQQQHSSITCVNGQRIRVRPSLSNINYEHTLTPLHTTTKQLNIIKVTNNLYNIKEANIVNSTVIGSTNTGTTFKSILKKNSTSNLDEETEITVNGTSNSSTSTRRSRDEANNHRASNNEHLTYNNGTNRRNSKNNTQFYIPMPSNDVTSSPRKKVQFLMSPEKGVVVDQEDYYNIPLIQTTRNKLEDEEGLTTSIDLIPQYQPSISDRFDNESVASKVVFHDSIARVTSMKHEDTRTLFSINSMCSSKTDLERLDGVRSKGRSVKRPVAPPPKPPNSTVGTDVVVVVPSSLPVVPPRKRSNNKQPPVLVLENVVKISHRIQIRNELPIPEGCNDNDNVNTINVFPVTPLTTSILIGPDDHCYSTVNVNGGEYGDCCYPHYRSSVVVSAASAATNNAANYSSSKVYLTGTCCGEDKDDVTTKKGGSGVYEEICTDTQEKRSYQQPKYEDIVYTDSATQHELTTELLQTLLCDPVEAVRRNLVPHVCGKDQINTGDPQVICNNNNRRSIKPPDVARKEETSSTKEVSTSTTIESDGGNIYTDGAYEALNGGSTTSSAPSDCYTDCNSHSNRSSVTEDELHARNSKFYELLADASLAAEVTSDLDLELDLAYDSTAIVKSQDKDADNHHYESILMTSQQADLTPMHNSEPIYEDIDIPGGGGVGAVPPPLPVHPPPSQLLDDLHVSAEYTTRSIFEGASKYDILSYLVDAKERGCVNEATEDISEQEEGPYSCSNSSGVISTVTTVTPPIGNISSHDCNDVIVDDSVQPLSSLSSNLSIPSSPRSAEIERNDSGVGSETSKCSLSKYRNGGGTAANDCGTDNNTKITQSCEDCDNEQENDNSEENGVSATCADPPAPLLTGGHTVHDDPLLLLLQPLLCRRCAKRRVERREIIMEIVETEEKYMRDLQITLEEFYHPMLIAGLLTPDQLQAIFLNIEELLDNSTLLSDRLRDTVDIAIEQGDEDMLQVDIGRLFLDAGVQMLHAFEVYCVRQGGAALLLAGLEKEKELLRVFLRVSQMENVVLRRMNLSSFLMVPVQRVTKYPLLLARLYKVTPSHQEDTRARLHEAQHTIELHLNHINSQTHNIPTKLWRRLNSTTSNNGNNVGGSTSTKQQHSTTELVDLVGIKLRKIAVDALDWNHEEATFALEGRLLVTQPQVEGHHQWRKGRTIKLSPVCALLVTCGGGGNRRNKGGHKKYSYGSYGSRFMSLGGRFSTNQSPQGPQEKPEGGEQMEQGGQSPLVFPARQHKSNAAANNMNNNRNNNNSVVREAALLLLRDKGGRHSLLREPLYLDRCVVAADPAWQSYFEVQELHHTNMSSSSSGGMGNLSGGSSGGTASTHNNNGGGNSSNSSSSFGGQNATYIFRAEDDAQTRMWYKQLQFYAQGMGTWRRRRNALPNIMIAGLGLR